jgi:hypothetical protein
MSEEELSVKPGISVKLVEPENRIGLYVRSFSEDGHFAETMESRLRETVDRLNRYRRLGEVVAVFRDQGRLFEPNSCFGLRALKKAVRKKQVTLVFVPEFRDLTVSFRELLRLLRFLDRHGCGLRSLNEYLLYEDLSEERRKLAAQAIPPTSGNTLMGVSKESENEPAR